jgi:CSLREA domain-containing protein
MSKIGLSFFALSVCLAGGCGLLVGEERVDCVSDGDCASGHECKATNCVVIDPENTTTDGGDFPGDAGPGAPDSGPSPDGGVASVDGGPNAPDSGPSPDSGVLSADAGNPDGGLLYNVGVTVSGYKSASPLHVVYFADTEQVGGADIYGNGYRAFTRQIPTATDWKLEITADPTFPAQVCTFDAGGNDQSGTIVDADVNLGITCVTQTFTLNVDISGVAHNGMTIRVSKSLSKGLSSGDNGTVFLSNPQDGTYYDVQVLTQPTNGAKCWSLGGRGMVQGTDPIGVKIICGDVLVADSIGIDASDTTLDLNCDSAMDCTLRAAIQTANRRQSPTWIELVAGGDYPLGIVDDGIEGSGAQDTAVGDLDVMNLNGVVPPHIMVASSGGMAASINGAGLNRIFDVKEGSLRVQDVDLMGGAELGPSEKAGLVFVRSAGHGEFHNTRFLGGIAGDDGGAMSAAEGSFALVVNGFFEANAASGNAGAIRVVGDVRIFESAFINNGGDVLGGGAITVGGSGLSTTNLLMVNTTLGGNTALNTGGALQILSGKTTLVHNTITQNSHETLSLEGGDVFMRANVLANNNPTECHHNSVAMGETLTSWGHNFLGWLGNCTEQEFTTQDFYLVSGMQDPMLAVSLVNPSDFSASYEPDPGSPLLGIEGTALCPLTDQRGNGRLDPLACDLGAVEKQ